ncbi:MDMPI N domain containing protein [Streptomyces sp. SID5785]|uniref:zf-HC2 domain-containing protein n=1 Tax=Streptomyces sp. SID5785 TaxID=2690309 RepID=UPI001361AA91|nr:MDMPI N domain containing protein [Streptomyces sp. SID5785]
MTGASGPDRFDPHDRYEDGPDGPDGRSGAAGGAPRIPTPRASVEDTGRRLPELRPQPLVLDHQVLKSLLGAWALAACSPEESAAVEDHLGECGTCAEEALRLRDAVGLLHTDDSLDLDPMLRSRVLEGCLARRPARIPVPSWATPYDAETARLDALLKDFGDGEWHAPVRLRWFEGGEQLSRRTTVAGVIAHLISVDGLVARALGLDDPLGSAVAGDAGPAARTEALWRASHFPPTRAVRAPWREQSHALIRTVSFAGSDGDDGGGSGRLPVSYGDFGLPLRDAMADRAFECWVHAGDIADAVDYPYEAPAPRHLHRMIDLAARLLPGAVASSRPGGADRGAAERLLRLEVEGAGGGEWMIPLGPDGKGAADGADEVAHIALDGVEFCRLASGRVPPADAAAGSVGDRAAIMDVLSATATLSRM